MLSILISDDFNLDFTIFDEKPALQPSCSMSLTPKPQMDEDTYFTNNRAILKKTTSFIVVSIVNLCMYRTKIQVIHYYLRNTILIILILISEKRKLDLDMPQKRSVSTRFNHLAS